MAFARTILALLIALAVATVPAAGSAVPGGKSHDAAETSASASMDDCCPRAADTGDKAVDDCGSMSICALKCFGYCGTSLPLAYPCAAAIVVPSFECAGFRPQSGIPPFRPPRV